MPLVMPVFMACLAAMNLGWLAKLWKSVKQTYI